MKNSYESQKTRGLKRKYEAIISKGGCCEKCGYNKNISALNFHHRDPTTKKFGLDVRQFSNNTLETLKEELNKCDLLCANCHSELHNPTLELINISNLIIQSQKSFSNQNEFGRECPVCKTRFPKSKGKIYCSDDCRNKSKNYPTIDEVNSQYSLLKS